MSQITKFEKSKNADHIYYDLTLRNFQSLNREFQQLKFNETRSIPYVPNASEYVLSIVRFTVESFTLPSFQADIEPNQGNRDLMIQSITLEYDDGSGNPIFVQQPLIWVPTITITPPNPPNSNPDGLQSISPYYYSYSYQHVIDICNTAFTSAMNSLIAVIPALSGQPSPFFGWSDNIASLYCLDSLYSDSIVPSALTPKINIYFNRAMNGLFNSIPTFRNSITATFGRINRVLVNPMFGTNVITNSQINSNNPTIVVRQEYSTISNWQPVLQIVFTSNTLPIYPNALSAPLVLRDGQQINFTSNNSAFANILTDLSAFDQSAKPTVVYTPTAEYRRIDLQSVNQPLSNLDINVYWRDKNGRLIEFILGSGACCSMKILFEKKHLIQNQDY